MLALIAFSLLLAAWVSSCVGQHRAAQLDLSRFGDCGDIYDALNRDGYVAKFELPYFTAAVILDGLAVLALFVAYTSGQFRLVGGLVAVVCMPTVAWHLLGWFVTLVFAS